MVSDPEQWLDPMHKAGINQFTFHLEAVGGEKAIESLIEKIKEKGIRCGLAIKPKTPVEEILKFVAKIDTALGGIIKFKNI